MFEDRDPIEGYKLVSTKTCPDCNGTGNKKYIAKYPLWKELSDLEKGTLILAHHNGEEIQSCATDKDKWTPEDYPGWYDEVTYRVKPKPKIETVKLFGSSRQFDQIKAMNDRYVIKFDMVDGVPDCTSIEMSKL